MARKDWSWLLLLGFLAAFWLLRPGAERPAVRTTLVRPLSDPPKLVALTFDDGPKASTTAKLLDGLDRRGVKATFFLIGKQLEGNEDLVRRMFDAGHQIGVHTYDHVSLTGLSAADLDAQVGRTRRALSELLGPGSYLLRPPYGAVDDAVRANAHSPVILWSVDPEDWHDRSVAREVEHILAHVQPGDIILMHDIFPESVDAALEVVDRLHRAGWAFVTVDELFAGQGLELRPGQVYRYARVD